MNVSLPDKQNSARSESQQENRGIHSAENGRWQHGMPGIADAPARPDSANHEQEKSGGGSSLQRGKPPTRHQSNGAAHFEQPHQHAPTRKLITLELGDHRWRHQAGESVGGKSHGGDEDEQVQQHGQRMNCSYRSLTHLVACGVPRNTTNP